MRRKLIIDGNAVYEIDDECARRKEAQEKKDVSQKKNIHSAKNVVNKNTQKS